MLGSPSKSTRKPTVKPNVTFFAFPKPSFYQDVKEIAKLIKASPLTRAPIPSMHFSSPYFQKISNRE